MALDPHVPRPRDWDHAALTRQVRANAGLRHDHLARMAARRAQAPAVDEELAAVERYLDRFALAGSQGHPIPWGHEWTPDADPWRSEDHADGR